jgi:dephospho-CoA kinase
MIIGLTGTFGAGKDEAARYFESLGFEHFSTADILREEATKRGSGIDRDSLRKLKNVLKDEKGDDYLAKEAVLRIKSDKAIISAIRSIGEVNYLKSLDGFHLVFVDAPIEVRYERIKNRKRAGEEELSLDKFRQTEEIEMSGQSSQRLDYSRDKADYVVINSTTKENLYTQLDEVLTKIDSKR